MYEKKRIFARVITKNSEIMTNLLLFGLGLQEIVVIALIVLLLFGGKKIPELMKGLGKGVKSFKDGMKEIDIDEKEDKEKSE
jgi:sec-independent protein translocase protein TatA